jgi:ATP adenylyltransferase
VSTATPSDACIFCAKQAEARDEENLILYRGRYNYVLLNLYPYTTGHLMVVPYAHIASLEELPPDAAAELMELTQTAVKRLREVYRPHGMNLGMNLGECAGAGIAGHIHLHILPRWYGDVSFMTSIGETRVLPEELSESWRRLHAAFLGR